MNNNDFSLLRRSRNRSMVALVLSALLYLPQICDAYHLPLWEMGAGAGVLNAPHYRGSKTQANIVLPIPYAIYRGDILRVDREEGVRGKLFESKYINLDLSFAGNIPVPDIEDSARAGMPGLDLLLEAGPELEIKLWQSGTRNQNLWFNIPYRFVFSAGDPFLQYQGWTLSPYINYKINVRQSSAFMRYSVSAGPIFAGSKYHNYFYEVAPEFVTPERQAYLAGSGYSGSRITASITRNAKKYFVGVFARYDNLEDAVFVDSPLVETRDYFIFGVAFAWIFVTSETSAAH
ncbi:MAG: MipA/OmpV family protein [Gammaproteobacteria bacterium]|nr:MipA/OmpV family protein [Gammaproteobacteria bacterium]